MIRELKKMNDVSILNDFFGSEMRFMVLQLSEEELGPIRYVSDMETEERFIFANYSPELPDD